MTLGFGYGTCTTAEATVAKVATLASYALVKNGIVAIKFSYAVPANATLNINKRGAKAIYYRGAKITADVIDKGDIATFVYDGANYQLLTVDSNNPSTRIDLTGKTIDLNDLTLADGVSHIKKYIEKTSGGAANISNIPVAGQPFILDVELIRWASTADYVSKQTLVSVGGKYFKYIRYCNSGAWENWVRQVFTDSNVNQTLTTNNASYPLLLAPSGQTATANAKAYFGTGINFNPSTKTLSTTTFSGALSGNASTATALTTSAGSATQPVYFSGGKPVACTYPLNLMKGATSSAAGTMGLVPAPAARSQDKFLRGDGTWQVPPTSTITIDTSLSSTSINPVQNKVINTALANKANSSHTHTISDITDLLEQISNIELLFDGMLSDKTKAVCRYDIYKTILIGVVLKAVVYYVGTYVLSNYTLNQMDINSYTSLYTSYGMENSSLKIEISRNTDNIHFSLRPGPGTYRIQIWGIT